MKRQIIVLLALVAGVGIGTATVQAQGKPKAYTISEFEPTDKAAVDAFAKVAVPLVEAAGGKLLTAPGAKITARTGEAPKGVSVVEWESLDKAEAYYKSPGYATTAPYREKAWKNIRSWLTESVVSDGKTLAGSKAYVISVNDPINEAARESFQRVALPATRDASGRPSGINGGKIVARIGEAPKSATLVGWDSVERLEAYYKSPAYDNLRSQQEKAYKVIRSYMVEAAQ